jgi:hypothetical protein
MLPRRIFLLKLHLLPTKLHLLPTKLHLMSTKLHLMSTKLHPLPSAKLHLLPTKLHLLPTKLHLLPRGRGPWSTGVAYSREVRTDCRVNALWPLYAEQGRRGSNLLAHIFLYPAPSADSPELIQ